MGKDLKCQGKRFGCMQWATDRYPFQTLKQKSNLVRCELWLAATLRLDSSDTLLNHLLYYFV